MENFGIHPTAELPVLLASRERFVLTLILEGETEQEVADYLVLSLGIVKRLIVTSYKKLGVKNRPQAFQRARYLGLISAS
jgi:LuxR family maltose regulon positive regulatory protein